MHQISRILGKFALSSGSFGFLNEARGLCTLSFQTLNVSQSYDFDSSGGSFGGCFASFENLDVPGLDFGICFGVAGFADFAELVESAEFADSVVFGESVDSGDCGYSAYSESAHFDVHVATFLDC